MTPSQIRTKIFEIADALDYELTFAELIRFLDTATIEGFIEHLRDEADIEDLLPA